MQLAPMPFLRDTIIASEFSLWRYRASLNIDVDDATWRRTTLGEGATAIVAAAEPNLSFKTDFAMPTLSFKDRGAAVMMAQAAAWGVTRVAVDSSGNAATSVAAYAARLRMACDVFVPASTSDGKLRQIAAHGATIHKVEGTREDTADAAQNFLDGRAGCARGLRKTHRFRRGSSGPRPLCLR
ncbi:MAG: pyridoxal-phosphate dependent enzyme, partial [Pseudomonadota bacterium]